MAGDQPVAEVLYLPGCPNHAGAVALVNRVRAELKLDVEVRVREISDPRAASRARFLGSPTIRVDGRDVEPGVEVRTDYALACRVYRTGGTLARQPDEQWVRDALARADTASTRTHRGV